MNKCQHKQRGAGVMGERKGRVIKKRVKDPWMNRKRGGVEGGGGWSREEGMGKMETTVLEKQ